MIPWPFELWFYTPRGQALVLACQPCGINGDMEWTCAIAETGEVRNFKNYEVRVARNETYGINPSKEQPEPLQKNYGPFCGVCGSSKSPIDVINCQERGCPYGKVRHD